MLDSATERTAPPLKWPAAFASRTIPVARAPFGITILPSTSTGEATVAEKFWPEEEVLEPSASSRTTEIVVSAGTVMGLGDSAARMADLPEPPGEPLGDPCVPESDGAASPACFSRTEITN